MRILKGLRNMLGKVKKALRSLPIQRIEKGVSVLVLWVSTLIFNVGQFLSKAFSHLGLTIRHLLILNSRQQKQLKSWLVKGVKLLTSTVVVSGMLISLLLLLMLVVVSFVVGLLLALSLIVLTAILTKLYPEAIK